MALNERLLAEAREAQAAQVHAQAQADLARVRFTDALRQLHLAGASMREIGRAVGLSHQRVHQLVMGDEADRLRCSFCGTDAKVARKLVVGPGVHVCDACVALADRTLAGDPDAEHEWAAQRAAVSAGRAGKAATSSCSFCGKAPDQVAGMAASDGFRICRECLDLCLDIIEEEPAAE